MFSSYIYFSAFYLQYIVAGNTFILNAKNNWFRYSRVNLESISLKRQTYFFYSCVTSGMRALASGTEMNKLVSSACITYFAYSLMLTLLLMHTLNRRVGPRVLPCGTSYPIPWNVEYELSVPTLLHLSSTIIPRVLRARHIRKASLRVFGGY